MSPLIQSRQVYMLSDGTGITAQHLGQSLMSQFENIDFVCSTMPYIDEKAKAEQAIKEIEHSFQTHGKKPIVFMTLVDRNIREMILKSHAIVFDLFHAFLAPLEEALDSKCSHTIGRSHGLRDVQSYQRRIDAVHYTLDHDDGIKTQGYHQADLIIIGVSRCGKTPTSLYLAMQYGLRVANYPITEDDGQALTTLPTALQPYANSQKLFGLTINAERLHHIRQQRRPDSAYASLAQCRKEAHGVEALYHEHNIPCFNSTNHSIEEIATRILAILGIERINKGYFE